MIRPVFGRDASQSRFDKIRASGAANVPCCLPGFRSSSPPSPAPPIPNRPKLPSCRRLIITGQNGHDWRATTPVLREMLEATGRFEVRVTEEFRGGGPETLAPYDLVILNYYDKRKPELRWGDRADAALLDYVRSGKGL